MRSFARCGPRPGPARGSLLRRRFSIEAAEAYDNKAKWRMAKFAAVGIPTFITFGLGSLIVHSPDNRARLEPFLPEFGESSNYCINAGEKCYSN
jgi:hypothetical protein